MSRRYKHLLLVLVGGQKMKAITIVENEGIIKMFLNDCENKEALNIIIEAAISLKDEIEKRGDGE